MTLSFVVNGEKLTPQEFSEKHFFDHPRNRRLVKKGQRLRKSRVRFKSN